jgi:hypothetical protein
MDASTQTSARKEETCDEVSRENRSLGVKVLHLETSNVNAGERSAPCDEDCDEVRLDNDSLKGKILDLEYEIRD